jgi:hypothetical protein
VAFSITPAWRYVACSKGLIGGLWPGVMQPGMETSCIDHALSMINRSLTTATWTRGF